MIYQEFKNSRGASVYLSDVGEEGSGLGDEIPQVFDAPYGDIPALAAEWLKTARGIIFLRHYKLSQDAQLVMLVDDEMQDSPIFIVKEYG